MIHKQKRIVEILNIEASSILQLSDTLNNCVSEVVQELINRIRSGSNIFFSGMGKCSFIAEKLAATYCSLGIPSFYLNCSHALHGDIGVLRKDDVVIIFSKSGETQEIIELANITKEFSALTIAITCSGQSRLSGLCDLLITIPIEKEADTLNLVPTSSVAVFLALGDAIGIVISEMLGFTKEDFNKRHPKGKLGKLLK